MPDLNRPDPVLRRLRWPLALTRAGLWAEALWRAFWPFISVLMAVSGVLMLGLQDLVATETAWMALAVAGLAALACLMLGVRRFHRPRAEEARARLDATLPGRPIQALLDDQAIGGDDPASVAVWRAHQARMAARAAEARPVAPDLRIARRDPYALRYVAALLFAVALLFGSIWRVSTVSEIVPGGGAALASGPAWEGWIEPPRYTGLPTLYLNDLEAGEIRVAESSRITLRFYGEVGALEVTETLSGRPLETDAPETPDQSFEVAQSGQLAIEGPGGRAWEVSLIPDAAPEVAVAGAPEARATGEMTLPFAASDDYAVIGGRARIELDLDAVDRRHGLTADPDPREGVTVELPMPIAGDRSDFTETLIEDFSKHPWANLPVRFTLSVSDAAGQTTAAAPFHAVLPARRFFDPMAAAVIEQRRDLLWSRDNGARVAQVLRAISHRPEDAFRSETAYLRLRFTLRRLETFVAYGLEAEQQEEIAEALWELAIILEEGDLGDALERLRRAQERLAEAMKNGASDQEIAELMQELREATDDYLRQLSRQAQQEGEQQEGQQGPQGESMQMTQNDLQRMMDRIQELMEQGRMAEAQQALEELQQLMENMRVTQGQGQGNQSEGQQAMEGLAETLREQQGLSDQAFRDLQEQFNPDAQQGQSQGNEGRDGGMGRGEQHEGQGSGQGQNGESNQRSGENGEPGRGDQPGEESLADRQQALRDELNRQQQNLPGAGTPEGDAAREALGRAGEAMDGAEDALRQDDYATAIDRQSEAMEALREGMRALGEAMARNEENQQGQGDAEGDMRGARNRDPLGRNTGSQGSIGTDENLLQGEDVYRRARELLDEIRRRSGETGRPDLELEYLKRLLERF